MRPDPASAPSRQRRVAFVLSGGGSLGAMQVGMLQALFEEGIRPDLLVGTSAGAVNAAWVAGYPHGDGVRELAGIWRGLRCQDIFPISPWAGARGLLGEPITSSPTPACARSSSATFPTGACRTPRYPFTSSPPTSGPGTAWSCLRGRLSPPCWRVLRYRASFPRVTIGRRELVDGGVADMTPIAAAIEQGATQVYVLPIGYPWFRQEQTNAIGMALQALARVVEQRLHVEIAVHKYSADICLLPTIDGPAVSPADFSRTPELISRAYRVTRRYLSRPRERDGASQRRVLELAPMAEPARVA